MLFYENPNTPPSERTIQKADKTSTENIPVPKKRGAPIGHKGATRPTKEPENTKEVIADHCEKCNSPNIEKLDKCETSIIEDMPPPQKITITQYNRWEVKCLDCGHQFMSKDPECPKTGSIGINWWLWIFRTDTNEVLVVIRKSRGKKVLEEILGKEPEGVNGTDGWRAYSWMKLQRCWAHLLRDVDAFNHVSENGKRFSEDIHSCFKKLREFLDRAPSMEERIEKKAVFEKELEGIIAKYSEFKELKKPLTYLKNGCGCWYTCLLYPGMEPTNNLAEQAIREHVIMRKIIGCFRSEKGAENYQYIASLLATCRLQDKNGFDELEKVLRRELCMS